MLCQKCQKNDATIHITDVESGEHRETHLCDKCAESSGTVVKTPVTINQLLSSLIAAHSGAAELAEMTCPQCGISFLEFRQQGLLGCPNDYEGFSQTLDDLLVRVHGKDTQHIGKVPSRTGTEQKKQMELLQLRRELAEAVEKEEYETAAQLRDRIKECEQNEAE